MVTEVELVTTQAKLSRLIETKNAIRQKLISLGVDVPVNTPFEDYADLMKQLDGTDFIETTTDQELLQLLDLYKWLSTNEYEDYTYPDIEIQAVHNLLDTINNGESIKIPEVITPYLTIIAYGKVDYLPGELFDSAGYIIKLVQSNGEIKDVTDECIFTPNTELNEETDVVTVTYTSGDILYTTHIQIAVSGYTELEYIKANGAQYIDTGIVPDQDTKIEMDVTFTTVSSSSNENLWCARTGTESSDMFVTFRLGNKFRADYHTLQYTVNSPTLSTNVKYNVCRDANKFYINNNLVYTNAVCTFKCPNTMTLFMSWMGNHNNTQGNFATFKLHYCKIYDKGVMVRDYIPVKRKADNAICLYDKVTKSWSENLGTGVFTAGPEKTVEEVE